MAEKASAQPGASSFSWTTYEEGGKTHYYPKWNKDGSDFTLNQASGRIKVDNYTITKATMYVYKPGALPGSWEKTASITNEKMSISEKFQVYQTIAGGDNNTPKIRFPANSSVLFTFELAITDGTTSQTVTFSPPHVQAGGTGNQ